jgi:predicted ferric reductase
MGRLPEEAWARPAEVFESALAILLGSGLGILLAWACLQGFAWWPELARSLAGPSPKAYWYLSRASGLVAYLLLSLSVALGLLITGKLTRPWPGGPTVADLHQFTGLLGLGLALFHAAILLGDRYIGYTPLQLLLPFTTRDYRPLWVGLGQVAFYLGLLLAISSAARRRLGYRCWRALHFSSFGLYLLATMHGAAAGSDTAQPAVFGLYCLSGLLVFFLTVFRVLSSVGQARPLPR